jgi:cytochrome b561
LSAARYPIGMFGSLHLFPILPHDVMLYAFLRKTHTFLAYLLFFAFVGHFGAVSFHTLVLRDGQLSRKLPGRDRAH